ncbi:MAG: hypothetical protein E7172_03295 [Firmicutes bacterium]|nr:hypothetical protein [Bacillota bacterium]
MKKKIILLIFLLLCICGCTNIKNLNYEQIVNTLEIKANNANQYRSGYKYFLPRDMKILDSKLFNEVLTNKKEIYYLYVDALSYQNKIENEYVTKSKSYYSKNIKYNNKFGYLEINLIKNEQYLIEFMYNYAKIEVMVNKENINRALLTSISILKSVKYNDSIIANLFGNDILNFTEEEFNIFNTTSSDSTYIQIDDTYPEVEEEVPDTDLIN